MSIFSTINKQKSQIIELILILGTISPLFSACSRSAQGADVAAKPKQALSIGTLGNQLEFDRSTLRTQSGATIELTFTNNSTLLQHNWVLVDGGEVIAEKIYQEALAAGEKNAFLPDNAAALLSYTKLTAATEQRTITFTAPAAPGDYTFLCTYPGHYLAGMKGTLTVSAP